MFRLWQLRDNPTNYLGPVIFHGAGLVAVLSGKLATRPRVIQRSRIYPLLILCIG
jgi:hypothetical protein